VDGALVSGCLATDAKCTQRPDRLTGVQEKHGKTDSVTVTGDVSDDASEQSYSRFKTLTEKFSLPVFNIRGQSLSLLWKPTLMYCTCSLDSEEQDLSNGRSGTTSLVAGIQ